MKVRLSLLGVCIVAVLFFGFRYWHGISAVNRAGIVDERKFGPYVFRIYRSPVNGQGSFHVIKDGKLIDLENGFMFSFPDRKDLGGRDPVGSDITGEGRPNLVLENWTGGAHCCAEYYIFRIGEEFDLVDKLDAEHNDVAPFEDLDGDGVLEIDFNDWTFAYWRTSFFESPAPRVVLKFRHGRYEVATELMKAAPPDPEEVRRWGGQFAQKEEWRRLPLDSFIARHSELWGYMLELLYTGNGDAAWRFLDRAWPPDIEGKEQFKADFLKQLSESRYWPEIKKAFYPQWQD